MQMHRQTRCRIRMRLRILGLTPVPPPSFLPFKAAAYNYSATSVSGFRLPIAGRACKDLCRPVGSRRRHAAGTWPPGKKPQAAARLKPRERGENATPRHANARRRTQALRMNAASCASSLPRVHPQAAVHPGRIVERSRLGPASACTAQHCGLGWIVAPCRILHYGGRKERQAGRIR
ncbi:hypothetical protein C8Q74DRAFT_890243 [Fomes fomentarius]|nr:hypothetical protein C8Q74DRAFT_890243 [Fomes fomentarius]